MNYLCLALKKEVTRSESGSREQAQEYFFEKFGDCVKEELEREKKKLESRIRYYDRREARHKDETEVRTECCSRREAAQRELDGIIRQLHGDKEELQVWYYEEKNEWNYQDVAGKTTLMLRLTGICRVGSGFQVIEERYHCVVWKCPGDKGIMEVRKRIPNNVIENSISLDISSESQEAIERFQKKIKKMMTESRKKFRGYCLLHD